MGKIEMKVSEEVREIIRHVSNTLELPMSYLLREVLKKYKSKNIIMPKEDTNYSKTICIRPKDDVTVKDYYSYAKTISNEDIVTILKELYNITL